MANLLEEFIAELNGHFFLRECSFAKNCLRDGKRELEFADHVIALPDATFVFQMKERWSEASTDPIVVHERFQQTVVKKTLWSDCGFVQLAPRSAELADPQSAGPRARPSFSGQARYPNHRLFSWRDVYTCGPFEAASPEQESRLCTYTSDERLHGSLPHARSSGRVNIGLFVPTASAQYVGSCLAGIRIDRAIHWHTTTRLPSKERERFVRDAVHDAASFEVLPF